MVSFNRVFVGVVCLSGLISGCANIGCKYDMRKYPTPIMQPTAQRTHIWNPDACTSDAFDSVLPPGYQNRATSTPASPLPKGPATPPAKVSLLPPFPGQSVGTE